MKKILLAGSVLMLAQLTSMAQNSQDLTKINEAIHAFAQAGDQQDAGRLDKILHPQYRAVVHRAFGSTELSLMDKALYLQLIRDKKVGGDTREVLVLQVDVVKNIATVKAIFQGKALRFTTYMSLVKLADGTWQIVSDMPDIEQV